jgi:hypothetical protein
MAFRFGGHDTKTVIRFTVRSVRTNMLLGRLTNNKLKA